MPETTPILYGIQLECDAVPPSTPKLLGIQFEMYWPTHGKELAFKSGVKTKRVAAGVKAKEVDN